MEAVRKKAVGAMHRYVFSYFFLYYHVLYDNFLTILDTYSSLFFFHVLLQFLPNGQTQSARSHW